jgi:ribosomal protein RSM22 (predicted rRNA methylase)
VETGGCLVIVELGTNAGFQIISEARDFLLQVSYLLLVE